MTNKEHNKAVAAARKEAAARNVVHPRNFTVVKGIVRWNDSNYVPVDHVMDQLAAMGVEFDAVASRAVRAAETALMLLKAKQEKVFVPKPNTKRGMAYEALTRLEGCSLAQASEMLGWSKNVCGAEFWEIARLAKKKLVREADVYRMA